MSKISAKTRRSSISPYIGAPGPAGLREREKVEAHGVVSEGRREEIGVPGQVDAVRGRVD